MTGKMPCHISDGPQEPDDVSADPEVDEDLAYETYRQEKIDNRECMACHRPHLPNHIFCRECLNLEPGICTSPTELQEIAEEQSHE